MIRNKNFFILCVNAKVGGGGFKCPCCFPRQRDARRREMRAMRKRFDRLIKKIEKSEE